MSVLRPPRQSLIHSTNAARPTRGGRPSFPKEFLCPLPPCLLLSPYRSCQSVSCDKRALCLGKRPVLSRDTELKCWRRPGSYIPTGVYTHPPATSSQHHVPHGHASWAHVQLAPGTPFSLLLGTSPPQVSQFQRPARPPTQLMQPQRCSWRINKARDPLSAWGTPLIPDCGADLEHTFLGALRPHCG